MTNPIVVWTEIPVTDIEASCAFYSQVFGWEMKVDHSGPVPMAIFNNTDAGVGGHLFVGEPANNGGGNRIHFAVPDSLAASTDRAKLAGGTVMMGPVDIPPGSFTFVADPDGNTIGLFEPKAA